MPVGYQASDPPVRYLLEGLNASKAPGAVARIYAFDHGHADEVLGRWRSRGVTALPYSLSTERSHEPLWNTLRLWADGADQPDAWKASIIGLAQRDPGLLHPHERGRVVSLVNTAEGATAFARAEPAPSAEWLCVFDRHVRYGGAGEGSDAELGNLATYGLDGDPPPPVGGDEGDRPKSLGACAEDPIAASLADERTDRLKRIAGVSVEYGDRLAEDPEVWMRFGRHFFNRAWPREARFKTPELARQFAFLAEQSGDHFPLVVKAVSPFLVRSDGLGISIHRATRGGQEESLAKRFPAATLDLFDRLVPDEPATLPF